MKSPTALRPPKNETQNELRQMKTPLQGQGGGGGTIG